MTLRIASLRLDPVSPSVDGQGERAIEEAGQLGEGGQPRVARRGPALLQHHDRGGAPALEAREQLRAQGLDPRVLDVVEEIEVVDEAGGLPEPEPEQSVDAA